MAFEKIKLLTGEFRAEYVQRRLAEGAKTGEILAEINGPELFTGEPGRLWGATVVITEKHKMAPTKTAKPAAAPAKPEDDEEDGTEESGVKTLPVPDQYQDILDPEDIAEIHAEAEKAVRSEQRKLARADLLKKVKEELKREARLAMQRGQARGDYVDVYVDLASYSPYVKLDGEPFHHGRTYRVSRAVAAVITEQCQRSWQHQEGISGQRKDMNRQRRAIATPAGPLLDGVRV